MLAVAAGLGFLHGHEARSQGLTDLSSLPSIGTTVRAGDLRDHLSNAAPGQGLLGGRAFTVTTSIDVQELATDNASTTASGAKRGDFITSIRPNLSVSAETARFQGNFSYSPSANIYANDSTQSYIGQNFSGSGHAILAPDLLFLDVRGFTALQSLANGAGPTGTTTLNRQNQTQSTSFSAAPYLSHKFGGTGTLEAGVSISYSANSDVTGLTSNSNVPQANLGLLTPATTAANVPSSNYIATEEHASFTSGEDTGRFSHRVSVSGTQYSGDGVYRGAYRALQTYDIAYAVSRFITALGEIGHESIHYGGLPPVRIDDGVWNVGAKFAPDRDSALTLTYGHHDGGDALTFDGRYDATARLRLYARYTESLTTSAEDLSDALASVDTTQPGGLFDRSNGAPVTLTDNFFGQQNNLYRLKRFTATASLVYDRDVFSFTATQQSRHAIAQATVATPATSDKGIYGSLSWSHDLAPDLQTNAFVQYGTYSSLATAFSPASNGNKSFIATVSIIYKLSETLSTNAQYSFSKNTSNTPGLNSTQNAVLVGVHKQF